IDRAAAELERLAREVDVVPVEGDVTREEDVDRLFALVEERFGRLSVLVNNVGYGVELSLEETPPDQWHFVLDTCLTSYYFCARRALPLLRGAEGPSIVNVS